MTTLPRDKTPAGVAATLGGTAAAVTMLVFQNRHA
jgi:hypothetical protein